MSGKLLYHIFSAIGEFERELIRERTVGGMMAAKARGKHVGRPPVLNEEEIREAHEIFAGGTPISHVARTLGVSQTTLKRSFARLGMDTQLSARAARA